MERCERREVLDLLLHVLVDAHCAVEARAALDHPVADAEQVRAVERGAVRVELPQQPAEGVLVVGDHATLDDGLDAGRLVLRLAGRLADALDQAGREGRAGVDVDELVLEARRAGVDDEDGAGHARCPAASACAWIAVIAMVLTMSLTSAPRERSLTGLFSPCSTGPIASAPAERCTAL